MVKGSRQLVIRILYVSLWLLVLVLALLPDKNGVLQSEVTDYEGAAMLYGVLLIMSLPISAILAAVLWGIGRILMYTVAGQELLQAIEAGYTASGDPKWFVIKFPICWFLLLIVSYWQWFWLTPRFIAALKRRFSSPSSE